MHWDETEIPRPGPSQQRGADCFRPTTAARALQPPRAGRWPGVRSPAHARGAPDVVHVPQCHQHQPSVRRARTPRMGPATVPRATCPGTWVAGRLVAGHRRWQQGGGGAPGRRTHSRCPGCSHAWTVMTRLSVVDLGGAPRAWAGERGRRLRPGERSLVGWACTDKRFRSKPRSPPLARRLACAQRRTAAKGRKQPFTPHRSFTHRGSREARWSN